MNRSLNDATKKLSMLPILSPDRIQSAENKVVSAAQRFSDQETYVALSNGALKPTNSLRKLSLFFDEDDVIRVRSRLLNSEDLSFNMRCPISERIIQSMKRAMKHVVTPGLLREDEFLTAAKLAEGILNTRPLSYTSNVPDDLRPLTPAHFLTGSALKDISPIPLSTSLAKRYNLVHKTLDNVWSRYQKEILPQLRVVNKWLSRRDDLAVGDVVIIMDDPDRGSFPLGKIVAIHPNPADGIVRSVSVAVGPNVWRRHSNSLLLLVRPENTKPGDANDAITS
jgi:hypothetical protein